MANEILDDSAKSVVVSINPGSGATDRRKVVELLVAELRNLGFDVHPLTEIEEVKSVVAKLMLQAQLRAVVAAGGDGTVTLLANCLPPQTPIAILPLGTENLLAKFIGLTSDPKSIAKMIANGSTVKLDAGRANGQLFLVMASCGFDAEVVHRVHARRTGHIQYSSYIKPIVNAIRRYRYPKIRIRPAGQKHPIIGKWAFVFNVPRYAMNLPIVPDADPRDGQLDLCTFRGGNLIRGLFYLLAVFLRQHRGWKYSHFQRFERVTIEADDQVPYQLDGDPGGVLPLSIEVMPKFLKVLVPQNWNSRST